MAHTPKRKLWLLLIVMLLMLGAAAGGALGYRQYAAHQEQKRAEMLRQQRIELAKKAGKEVLRNEFPVISFGYEMLFGNPDKKD